MKKFSKYLLFICSLCFIPACEKEIVSGLDDSVDARINTLIDSVYVKALKSAEYGWMASIGTSEGYYRFWMEFRDNNVVVMQTDNAMYENQYKGVPEESTCTFKALQRPTLIFDTYSYLSLINDPNPSISGASDYRGLGTDFEFEVEKYENGVFYMTGRFNKVKAVFKKASEKEKEGVEAGLMMELPRQVANDMANLYIKANSGEAEVVMKVVGDRQLYTFRYDWGTDTGEEKAGYYNVEVDGSQNLFFPEELQMGSISITGLNYSEGKYDHFNTPDPNVFIDVDISHDPPTFPIPKIFGAVGSDRTFDELHCPMGFTDNLSSGEAKSSVELMSKFLNAAILCLGYEINCYFTPSSDDNGNSQEWNIALENVTGIGVDLETGSLTASFPSAIYTFPVTVENDGLTFTTGKTVRMLAGARSYYDKGVMKQLVDNFTDRKFTIAWSKYQYSEGLILDIISQDKNFNLPVLLNKH